ncbi:MAG: 8-oxo-dGTP diphosphatase MutT [Clostridia bacterium]|nr:8-oxo-dGTP diphosphatase MutT [Clostridia bacterium]
MIAVVAALIVRENRLLIARRPEGKHMAGKWEFPGGKIERGETPEQALERELKEELGVKTETGRIYHAIAHSYPEKDVLLMFYRSRLIEGEPEAIEEAELKWITESELRLYPWAEADAPLIDLIEREGFGAIFDN